MFRRVNDPIAFEDSGDVNEGKLADITSETGTITFLAPSANVGSVDADQNFVQRASEGSFYGLNSGRFFSDDIGSTSLLQTIPTDALATFETQIDELNLLPPTDVSLLVNNLVDSSRATASACNTTAASSSRSTAASQRGEEEEVAEVDEQAFVNLVTFDAPPDSVRLPETRFSWRSIGRGRCITSSTSTPDDGSTSVPGCCSRCDSTCRPRPPSWQGGTTAALDSRRFLSRWTRTEHRRR